MKKSLMSISMLVVSISMIAMFLCSFIVRIYNRLLLNIL